MAMQVDSRSTTCSLVAAALLLSVWLFCESRFRSGDADVMSPSAHQQATNRTEDLVGRTSKEDSKAAALAYAKRQNGKYMEMGMFSEAADFELVFADGTVNPDALSRCGISVDKLGNIQTVTSKAWARMMRSMAERVVPDPENERGFLIPSAREAGDEILSELERDIGVIVGPKSATSLMAGLHATSRFGWFGKFDMRLVVTEVPSKSSQGSTTVVSCDCFDPSSGRRILAGGGAIGSEGFQRMFGPEFDLGSNTRNRFHD